MTMKIDKEDILKDLNAIFDNVVYERIGEDFVEIHIRQGDKISEIDFPHLLTLCKNLPIRIFIFVVQLNQLGILVKDWE